MDKNTIKIFHNHGFALLKNLIGTNELAQLTKEFDALNLNRPGTRQNSLPDRLLSKFASHQKLQSSAQKLIGNSARLVRLIAFNKTADNNWAVPWHQDRTIAVQQKIETHGFGPWSEKDGIIHVEPPIDLMSQMVTFRLHLDECGPENGPLEILPGSHNLGRISQTNILQHIKTLNPVICQAEAGDVLAMRSLTIHRSQKANHPQNRRIFHMDYAACDLPNGLKWAIEI